MKASNTISPIIKNIPVAIGLTTIALVALGFLQIPVLISASLLDYLLSFANIPPTFISLIGRGLLTLLWLIVSIKWWKRHKNEILRISQFTPEQRKEYEENKLKRKKAAEARNYKFGILLVVGFILYVIGKSNIGHALIAMLLDMISMLLDKIAKILNYKTLLLIIAFYVFIAVIQALNRISDNIYYGITEIKEKLDIIINQTE